MHHFARTGVTGRVRMRSTRPPSASGLATPWRAGGAVPGRRAGGHRVQCATGSGGVGCANGLPSASRSNRARRALTASRSKGSSSAKPSAAGNIRAPCRYTEQGAAAGALRPRLGAADPHTGRQRPHRFLPGRRVLRPGRSRGYAARKPDQYRRSESDPPGGSVILLDLKRPRAALQGRLLTRTSRSAARVPLPQARAHGPRPPPR